MRNLFLPTLLRIEHEKYVFAQRETLFVFAVLHTCKTRVPLIHHFSGTNSTYSKAIRIQSVWTLIFEEQTTYYIELPNSTSSSMTSLLMHTVAHSTRLYFTLKINNQLLKKFFSLSVSWVKVVKYGKILTFKVNFLCQKLSESF